jgi:ACR3 family arsenite efflux pump ArsB
VRNVAPALAIAVTILNRIGHAVSVVVFLLTEVPLLLGVVAVYRKCRAPGSKFSQVTGDLS